MVEETPRESLLEEVGARIRTGISYREVLAALFLAGIRNIQPRPSVGFKFHAVLVVYSAHQIAQASAAEDRWLPVLWALDHFKASQERDAREGDWTMSAPNPSAAPRGTDAVRAFTEAMDRWDEAAADAAAAALSERAGPEECFELFARYAARDIRSIGHKAIYVANGWRTLETIGWQHAQPVLRSLAYALLAREGSDPLKGDDRVDRPWRRNRELAARLESGWMTGEADPKATVDMLDLLRRGDESETADGVLDLLHRRVGAESVWDGLMAGAAELLMRNPGIFSLHAVTTANAMRTIYERSTSDETKRMLLLQFASFLPFYRRGSGSSVRVDELAPLEETEPTVEDICAAIGSDNTTAARKVLTYLGRSTSPRPLFDALNRLVFVKGNDSHDYKFSAAVLEDFSLLSPAWRNRYLAAGVFWLNGLQAPDNDLVSRARSALGG